MIIHLKIVLSKSIGTAKERNTKRDRERERERESERERCVLEDCAYEKDV